MAAIKNRITLEAIDGGVRFTFENCDHYLQNGTIDVPLNSLSLIFDESDMATFRKAASNDIFISAPISYFYGLDTKEDLADFYTENMVGGTGGGIDPETLAELVSSAEYVSSSSTIDFKNVDGDVISTLNAEPFITDGMVDNVQISGTNLVITFNVDAGKQPISIPLSSIFDPSNYYDKTATDTLLNGKVAVSDYNTYTAATNTALSAKADTSAVTAVADSLSGKQDTLVYYSEDTENNEGRIGTSVEDGGVTKSSEVRVASYMDADSEVSISASEYSDDYDKTAAFYGTQDGIEINYHTQDNNEDTSFDALLAINADGIYLNVDNGEDAASFNVTAEGATINGDEIVTESDLTASLSGKQDTLIAGSGITISGNVISAEGGGSITIDPTLDSGSTNAVANSAITNAFNTYTCQKNYDNGEVRYFYFRAPSKFTEIYNFSINGRCPLTQTNGSNLYIDKFSLVETSAITTSVTSTSTDAQVPSAKAVYDALGGLKFVKCSQAEYDALTTKDPMTIYFIDNVVNNA